MSVALSLLFVGVYNTTNWLASQRDDLPSWRFDWEERIPFVELMIVPYFSIDLFFVVAPFLCSDRRELRLFSKRIALAIVVAGVIFLLFPLKLAVVRPPASGMIGEFFNWFREYELPYNLCPSLHIALRTILADLYARHTFGLTRWAAHGWFFLIGLSTVLTYQHHVIDVVGGFVLAAVCFYVVRETPLRLPVERNERVGRFYAIGGAIFLVAAWGLLPWGWLLLWPAIAMGLVAAAYFSLGPAIYAKHNGRVPLSTRVLFAPVLLGQWLSWLYYRRQCRAWDEVAPHVWIGRQLTEWEAREAVGAGVVAVVDLTAEFSAPRAFLEVEYRNFAVLDLTAPPRELVAEAVAFVREQSARGVVYVHCKIGYSRSAAIVGSYLIATGEAPTADEAMARLRAVRPSIVIRPEAERVIRNAV
jgi:membrane-associated phospholipid phosphatase